MTATDQIVAWQKQAKAFGELGRLFNVFDHAHAIAWTDDTNSGWNGHYATAQKSWEKERIARRQLLVKLYELAGVTFPQDRP